MALADARRRCERLARSLPLPRPFSVEELCARLSEERERTITLLPTRDMSLGGLYGLWMGTDHGDYIFYEQNASPLHRQHIVLHEVGHILLGHTGIGTGLSDLICSVPPNGMGTSIAARDTYADANEYEAELFASLVSARIEAAPTLVREPTQLSRVAGSIGRTH